MREPSCTNCARERNTHISNSVCLISDAHSHSQPQIALAHTSALHSQVLPGCRRGKAESCRLSTVERLSTQRMRLTSQACIFVFYILAALHLTHASPIHHLQQHRSYQLVTSEEHIVSNDVEPIFARKHQASARRLLQASSNTSITVPSEGSFYFENRGITDPTLSSITPSVSQSVDTIWTLPNFATRLDEDDVPHFLSFDVTVDRSQLSAGDYLKIYNGGYRDGLDDGDLVQGWWGSDQNELGLSTKHVNVYYTQAVFKLHREPSSSNGSNGHNRAVTINPPQLFVTNWTMSADCPTDYRRLHNHCELKDSTHYSIIIIIIPGLLLIGLTIVWLMPREWRKKYIPKKAQPFCLGYEILSTSGASSSAKEKRVRRWKVRAIKEGLIKEEDKFGNDEREEKIKKEEEEEAGIYKEKEKKKDKDAPPQRESMDDKANADADADNEKPTQQNTQDGEKSREDSVVPNFHYDSPAESTNASQPTPATTTTLASTRATSGSELAPVAPWPSLAVIPGAAGGPQLDEQEKPRQHGCLACCRRLFSRDPTYAVATDNQGESRVPGARSAGSGGEFLKETFVPSATATAWSKRLRYEVRRTMLVFLAESIATAVNITQAILFVTQSVNDDPSGWSSDSLALAYLCFAVLAFLGFLVNLWSRICCIRELKHEMQAALHTPVRHSAHNDTRVAPQVELAFEERRIHHLKVIGLTLFVESLPFSGLGFGKLYEKNDIHSNLSNLISCAVSAFWSGVKITRLITIPLLLEQVRKLEEDAQDQEDCMAYREAKKRKQAALAHSEDDVALNASAKDWRVYKEDEKPKKEHIKEAPPTIPSKAISNGSNHDDAEATPAQSEVTEKEHSANNAATANGTSNK